MAAAIDHLVDIKRRLGATRARLRGAAQIDQEVDEVLARYHAGRYLKVTRVVREEHLFRQTRRGRPGPHTAYRKITKRRYDIEWTLDTDAIAYDQKSDGMYPLMTNDRTVGVSGRHS